MRSELAAVVADDHHGKAAELGQAVELAHDAHAGERAVDHQRQAAEVVDYDQDAEAAAVDQSIGDEAEGPALVRALRDCHWFDRWSG
jgi:hypothetical protein